MVVARYTDAGVLDASFNGSGYALSTDPLGAGGAAAMVQSDGRIVALAATGAGTRYTDGYALRYATDGGPDAQYGSGGRQPLALQPTDAQPLDGDRLLVAGVRATVQFVTEAQLLRLQANGAIDGAFGAGGRLTLGISVGGPRIGVAPDGRIVAIWRSPILLPPSVGFRLFVARRLAQGSPDPSFSDGAVVDLGIDAFPAGVVALPDGGTIIGAVHATGGGLRIIRLTAGGQLDSGFGTGGSMLESFASSLADLAVLADGRMLLAGGGPQLALARLLPGGSRDPNFGSGGVATAAFGDGVSGARRLVRQVDGRVVAVGSTGEFAASRLALARVLMDPPAVPCVALEGLRLRLRSVAPPAVTLRLSARLPASVGAAADPVAHGLRVAVHDGNGATFAAEIPAGAYQSVRRSGWRVRSSGAVTTWTYRDANRDRIVQRAGLRRDASGAVSVVIDGAHGALATTVDPFTVAITVAPSGAASTCGEYRFAGGSSCRHTAGGATVTCRD
jgi:uncharacterized delta-60 repeat protein